MELPPSPGGALATSPANLLTHDGAPCLDHRPGQDFQRLVHDRFGTSTHISSPNSSGDFYLVTPPHDPSPSPRLPPETSIYSSTHTSPPLPPPSTTPSTFHGELCH
ncbi:hypothetical protein HU200_018049 [Digitaria exilis]|uniref:Uncharacterized protein n=1 Tax=Digitaria exilis TaxID=1010633 RepID=A0A835F502_9POAL|nr:hypothetical protein HU200_018049 [Digitaria exilis]